MISFTAAAGLGVASGAYWVRFVQAKQLQKAFGYFLLAMAAFIFWQNRSELSSQSSQTQPMRSRTRVAERSQNVAHLKYKAE
jgi:hypothetical protein